MLEKYTLSLFFPSNFLSLRVMAKHSFPIHYVPTISPRVKPSPFEAIQKKFFSVSIYNPNIFLCIPTSLTLNTLFIALQDSQREGKGVCAKLHSDKHKPFPSCVGTAQTPLWPFKGWNPETCEVSEQPWVRSELLPKEAQLNCNYSR